MRRKSFLAALERNSTLVSAKEAKVTRVLKEVVDEDEEEVAEDILEDVEEVEDVDDDNRCRSASSKLMVDISSG